MLDGEIVVHGESGRRSSTCSASASTRPPSRVARLAEETPAAFIAFDLLARDDDVLLELPYLERRAALEALVDGAVELTPMVRTRRARPSTGCTRRRA